MFVCCAIVKANATRSVDVNERDRPFLAIVPNTIAFKYERGFENARGDAAVFRFSVDARGPGS
jgi:hypothetical protein